MKKHGASVSTCFALGLMAVLVLPPTWAGAQSFSFQTIDPPFGQPGIDINTQLMWINNNGVITTQFQSPPAADQLANMHTALLKDGQWTVIDVPGAFSTGGTNPNQHDQVVLTYQLGDGVWHATTYDAGTLVPFPDIPGYPGGIIVQGLNDRGQIAAVVVDSAGIFHGFVGTGDDFVIFDYPDPATTGVLPFMVNDAEVVVGTYFLDDGSNHAFRLDDGAFVDIDPPGAIFAQATGISNRGVIVGPYLNSAFEVPGFLLDHGQYTDFVVPDAAITFPSFINDRGQVSGIYLDGNFVAHGFVATPTGSRMRAR